jgi:hypothetical protein
MRLLDTTGTIPEVVVMINLKQLLKIAPKSETEKSSLSNKEAEISESDSITRDTRDLKMPKDLRKCPELPRDKNSGSGLTEGIPFQQKRNLPSCAG